MGITCVCCESHQAKLLYLGLSSIYSTGFYDLVRCNQCGNIITAPKPSENELKEIYSVVYLYPVHLLGEGEKKFRSRSTAKFISGIIPASINKDILEVGCMFGNMMDELKNKYSVSGIEIGEDAVNYCRKKNLDVMEMSIEDFLKANTKKFDIIIFSHVLEHLLEPDVILKQLQTILKPEGKIIISVPNSPSFCANLFGSRWGWWQVPVHINHFNLNALKHLIERCGYNVENVRIKGGDSLMLMLNIMNVFGFNKKQKNTTPTYFQKLIIGAFTNLLRYWYHIGNEELTVVISPTK